MSIRPPRPDMAHVRSQLPAINDWVDATIQARAQDARPLGDLCSDHFARFFSARTLATIRVVVTPDVPRPPVASIGLLGVDRELDAMAQGAEMRGETLDQVCFVNTRYAFDEQFPFHFVIHALQWRELGRERWLLNYFNGIVGGCGRANTWAEQQAGRLQQFFAAYRVHRAQPINAEQLVCNELRNLAALPGFPYVQCAGK